jgi:hypothetical protein
MGEPNDLDPQITDHPFQPMPGWEHLCGWTGGEAWPCGYAPEEHTERLEGAPEGGEAIEER